MRSESAEAGVRIQVATTLQPARGRADVGPEIFVLLRLVLATLRLLRLLLVGLFVFAAAFAALVAVEAIVGKETFQRQGASWAWLLVLLFLGAGYAYYLFNRPEDRDLFGRRDPEAEVRRLRELGMLVESEFRVQRVFEVEDGNVSQYVCELDDGSCLLLRGQLWWDYEHAWTLRGLKRRFPCTRFVLQQCVSPRYVVHVVCLGEGLEPEAVAPPFSGEEFFGDVFDGEITRVERPYKELEHLLFHERPIRSPGLVTSDQGPTAEP